MTGNKTLINIGAVISDFWNSGKFFPAVFAASLFFLLLDLNMAGMIVLTLFCAVLMVFCDDLLSITCPLLCVFLLSTEYYTNYTRLIPDILYAAVPFAAALVFNLIRYRRPFVKGMFTASLAGVSLALIVGGIGEISTAEYFRPVSLYYMLCLGVGMLLLYQIILSRLCNERSYDRTQRMADILYTTGLVAAVVIFDFYASHWSDFLDERTVLFFKPRNFVSSVLLMCLPASCLLINRRRIHIAGFAFMCLALIFSGSRSGLLFGGMLGFVCTVYICYLRRDSIKLHKWYNTAFVIGVTVLCYVSIKYIPTLYASRLVEGSFISMSETRVIYIEKGIRNFLESPINGIGIGNFRDVETFKAIVPGSIVFYHNLIIQIICSMGLLGVVAYCRLFGERIKLIVRNIRTPMIVFGFSYAGIFAMSLTNPGVFCPFPEAALLVLLFSIMEKETVPEIL